MAKINIKTSTIKKTGEGAKGQWTIRELTTMDGLKLDTFDNITAPGEYEGTIKPNENSAYNSSFSLDKKNAFQKKDYTFEKRRVAVECATSMYVGGKITSEQFESMRDKLFNYLNL